MGCAECLWWVRCCECDGGSCHLNPPDAEGAWPPTQADDFCGQFTEMAPPLDKAITKGINAGLSTTPLPKLSTSLSYPKVTRRSFTARMWFKPKDDA